MIWKSLITFLPGIVLLALFIYYWQVKAKRRGQRTLHLNDLDESIESWGQKPTPSTPCSTCVGGDCCTEHHKPIKKSNIVYYDDEELDLYKGRTSTQYKDEEAEEFREVFETLRPEERLDWLVSISKRGIALPIQLKKTIEKATQTEL